MQDTAQRDNRGIALTRQGAIHGLAVELGSLRDGSYPTVGIGDAA